MVSLDRRRLLQGGVGLGLSMCLPRRAAASSPDKSLLVVWLAGGPSQLETWDPHPRRSTTGLLKTSVADLSVADFFPRMADQMRHVSVIRSLVSKEGDHQRGAYALKTGYRMDPTVQHPSLGALLVHEHPTPTLEIPAFVSLGPAQFPPRGGYLGPRFDAFRIVDPTKSAGNLAERQADRMDERLRKLDVVSRAFPRRDEATMHEETVHSALRMMRSDQVEAFDVSDEAATVHASYGEDRFGVSCLIARRLIERGVRCVEVTLDGFDSHVNNHEAHAERCPILDRGLAALIADLNTRDLLRRTVVLCVGEFGRTPEINALDGRDHWPHSFSALIGGGGIRPGQIVGVSDPEGRGPPRDPVGVEDLGATLISALGMDPTDELTTPAGRPMPFSRGTAVKRLLP